MAYETPDLDMWSERAKVAISVEGGSDLPFEADTETVDIDIGDKDFDVIATLKGGRLVKFNPQDVTSITLEAYPLQAATKTGATAGTGFFDLVNGGSTLAAQPLAVAVDHYRLRYRLAVLWTNDLANTGAQGAVGTVAGPLGLRCVACGFFISAKPSFTDGALKFTIVMKAPPFKKDVTPNVKVESTDGTVTLAALASFTISANW